MTISDPSIIQTMATDNLYKQLVAIDKSYEMADKYLLLKLKQVRVAFKQYRELSNYFGEYFVNNSKNFEKMNDDLVRVEYIHECLDAAFQKFAKVNQNE